ncbi:MAG: helix-turn-helix domain-containing protein [Pseudoclavibacter sp.]
MTITPNFNPEMFRFKMADRMRKALDWSGLTNNEVANRIEVSRTTVSNWINGRYSPRRRDLKAFALVTGYPVQWLETGIAPTETDGGEQSHLRESNSRPLHYE